MLAVYFLVKNLVRLLQFKVDLSRLSVITTKWVISDPAGNTRRLSELVGASFFASFPEFTLSKFAGLRAYENWHVKEGLGAGALMAAAQARGELSNAEMMQLIDAAYSALNLQTA
jgi:NaMN:DMB phosphoribosyltransferase